MSRLLRSMSRMSTTPMKFKFTMVVEKLVLGQEASKDVQVKVTWSRGHRTTATELCTGQKEFNFNHELIIMGTLYKKKDNSFKSKTSKVVVQVQTPKGLRKFGKVEFDLTKYVDISSPMRQWKEEFPLNKCSDKKARLHVVLEAQWLKQLDDDDLAPSIASFGSSMSVSSNESWGTQSIGIPMPPHHQSGSGAKSGPMSPTRQQNATSPPHRMDPRALNTTAQNIAARKAAGAKEMAQPQKASKDDHKKKKLAPCQREIMKHLNPGSPTSRKLQQREREFRQTIEAFEAKEKESEQRAKRMEEDIDELRLQLAENGKREDAMRLTLNQLKTEKDDLVSALSGGARPDGSTSATMLTSMSDTNTNDTDRQSHSSQNSIASSQADGQTLQAVTERQAAELKACKTRVQSLSQISTSRRKPQATKTKGNPSDHHDRDDVASSKSPPPTRIMSPDGPSSQTSPNPSDHSESSPTDPDAMPTRSQSVEGSPHTSDEAFQQVQDERDRLAAQVAELESKLSEHASTDELTKEVERLRNELQRQGETSLELERLEYEEVSDALHQSQLDLDSSQLYSRKLKAAYDQMAGQYTQFEEKYVATKIDYVKAVSSFRQILEQRFS